MILCIYNESLHFCDIASRTIMQLDWIHYYKIHFCSHTECEDRCYSECSSLDFAMTLDSFRELVMYLKIKTQLNQKAIYVWNYKSLLVMTITIVYKTKTSQCGITNLQKAILLSIDKKIIQFISQKRIPTTPYNCM